METRRFFGTLALNAYLYDVRQWMSNTSGWPQTYWKQVQGSPDSYDLTLPLHAAGLKTSMKNFLGSLDVQIYSMVKVADFDTFLSSSNPAETIGVTDVNGGVSVVFDKSFPPGGGGLDDVENLPGAPLLLKRATLAHELGHVIDFALSNPSQSTTTGFGGALNTDKPTFNGYPNCTDVLDSTACALSGSTWFAKLDNFQTRRELFCQFIAYDNFPGSNFPYYELPITKLPTTQSWISSYVNSL